MKAGFYSIILLMACLLVGACQQEVVHSDEAIFHTWEAKEFISVESVPYEKLEGNPILLTFKRDGTYALKLDINSCGGNFQADTNWIELTLPICTEACCDSPFSYKLASMLPKVTSYTIEGETLKLNVPQWGYIELELVE